MAHFDNDERWQHAELLGLRRYLINPELGDAVCPEWYSHIRAAQYLGCAPWELSEQSVLWKIWALVAMQAEAEAQEALQPQPKSG